MYVHVIVCMCMCVYVCAYVCMCECESVSACINGQAQMDEATCQRLVTKVNQQRNKNTKFEKDKQTNDK